MVKTFRKELKDKLSLFIFALVQKNKDDEINNIINGFKLDDFKIENHVKTKLKLKERFAEIISPQEADKIVDESFEFALKTTEKETYQAMESFVHNLNTMHCLPYTEKIWVFDKKENELKLIEIGKLNEDYEVNRFYAISLNKKTFESELKLITQIQKKDNNRKLIKLKTKAGQEVITTDNHQILSLNYNDGRIVDKYPKEITNILSPRNLNLPNANNVINLEQYGEIHLRYEEFNKDSKYQKVFNIDVVEKTELNSGDEYVYDISVQDNENFLTKDCIFVHNSRAGAQVPFSSINFGMDTSEEGRMVSRNLLLAQEAGLGNGETPIFPILIFQVKEGVNYNPGDKNYDLFKLAMRVSAKRLFPNFVFVDAPFNLQYYNPNDPETIIATMGCVDGEEVITYKIGNNMYKESFEDVWNKFVNLFDIRTQGLSQYLELKNITIYDSSSKGFVECKKLIKNPDMNNWRKITFESGKTLLATSNHPLPIILDEKKQRVFVDDILMDSYGFTIKNNELEKDRIIQVEKLGYRNKSSYDVETESDYFDVSGILSHNCRTRVIGNVNGKETPVGRGNLSFTTINLPRLGIKHGYLWRKGKKIEGKIDEYDREQFYTELDSLIDTCILQLLERYEMQKKRHVNNFPFLMGQGVWRGSEKLQRGDELNSVIDTGTLSVGFIGLAECLVGLTGHHHGESEQLQKIGLEIIGHMRERMDEATEKYHLNFSLLGTPAEGLSGFFTRIDKKKYGIIEGITDKEYYTNSFHIPVYYKIGFADKIKKEAPYHALTNAGHITYVEMDGDPTKNLEAFELIVRCMKENGVGYGSINHPVDRDPVCGYSGVIEGNICPKCGRDISKPEIIQEKIKRKHI